MSDNTNNNNESLRDDWKDVGKGMGKTFAGLGKTLVKTAKIVRPRSMTGQKTGIPTIPHRRLQ